MRTLQWVTSHLFAVIDQGAVFFTDFVTGFLPALMVLMAATFTLRSLVGQERAEAWAAHLGGNLFLRYTLMPFVAVFFLTNPEAYRAGKHLPEEHKPAFYDAAVSFVHPTLGLFPHVNSAEIFIWAGVAVGVQRMGGSIGPLAVWYFLVGLLVIWVRGVTTQLFTSWFARRRRTSLGSGSGGTGNGGGESTRGVTVR